MSTETSVKQLPDGDAVFLSTETDTAWGHVGGMSILDPTGVPDFSYEKLCARSSSGSSRAALPLEAARDPVRARSPYWVECPTSTCASTCTASRCPRPAA
jgi:hypothetical protein